VAPSKKSQEIRQKINGLHAELVELERSAGIEREAERAQDQGFRLVIRDLYFSVPDLELRKRIIAKYRENSKAVKEWWHEEIEDARRGVAKARSSADHWWIGASISGVTIMAIGYYALGLAGEIGAAVLAIFSGMHMRDEAKRKSDKAVTVAECEMKQNEEIAAEPELFTRREEVTGNPDPEKTEL
jgi:hypothetical protein